MLKIGIIGVGMVAYEHGRAIKALGGQMTLAAAADPSVERLDRFCASFDVAQRHQDAMSLIADPTLDLIVITTPPSAHEAYAIAALDAGKHVLCEKPLAHSLASAARIAEAAGRHPGKLSISYQFRYGLPFRRLNSLARAGWLGEVQAARLERHSYIPHSSPDSWWGSWETAGGGVLITQLIHEIDMLIQLMGPAASVQAVMDTRFTGIESEDYVEALIRFRNGTSARCIASVNSGHLGGGLTVRGGQGAGDLNGGLQTARSGGPAGAFAAIQQEIGGIDPGASPYVALYSEIAAAIVGKTAMPIGAEEGLASLELCMAIYQAAIEGREVSLPLTPDSLAWGGVTPALYARRTGSRFAFPAAADDQPMPDLTPAAPSGGLKSVAKGVVKAGLELAQIQPATVRALVRKPGPVNGGPKTRRWPWPRRRLFDARERAAAMRVINREIRVGGAIHYGGAEEQAYCQEFARFLGGGFADGVNSGSNAVYIALKALNLPVGGEVVVPPVTDPGGMMPVALNMLIPIPCDSAPGSIMPTVKEIEAVMTDRTCAIVVAHMAGHAVDMDPILALAKARGIPVIEDCAQAHGTLYKGRMVGTLGTISAFSTMFGKHHATGGQGGVVFSRDPLLMGTVRSVADRGKALGIPTYPGNQIASLNFNQDELSMAIGRAQLAKLPESLRRRRAFAKQIGEGLRAEDGVTLIPSVAGSESAWWYLMVGLDLARLKVDSHGFAEALQLEGIDGVYPGYAVYPSDMPWHRQGNVFGSSHLPWALNQTRPQAYALPNARAANKAMVRIEIHDALTPKDGRDLIAAITKVARYNRT